MSTTIRVSEATRDRLAAIASSTGQPMTKVVDEAVDALERRRFFTDLDARYEQLRNDAAGWADVERERALEEGSLGDASA